jgi:hypothetical protein
MKCRVRGDSEYGSEGEVMATIQSALTQELDTKKRSSASRHFDDEKGQITHWYVAGTDTDDRKRAEERLRHDGVWLPAAAGNNLCIGLSFVGREIIASSLSTGHPIPNRTNDAKYSTVVERPTTPDTNGSGRVLREGQAGTEDQMASNLKNYQGALSSFVQAEISHRK